MTRTPAAHAPCVPTGLCVALVGFALVRVNDALDEYANPRLRRELG